MVKLLLLCSFKKKVKCTSRNVFYIIVQLSVGGFWNCPKKTRKMLVVQGFSPLETRFD